MSIRFDWIEFTFHFIQVIEFSLSSNSGSTIWPSSCCLTFLTGYRMGQLDRVLVDSLKPGETTDVSVSMISPNEPGKCVD